MKKLWMIIVVVILTGCTAAKTRVRVKAESCGQHLDIAVQVE